MFVYFGNLAPILESASSCLVPDGILAFSVEKLADPGSGYRLFPSGRYAHSQAYVENCLKEHGMAIVRAAEATIRKQSGDEVAGVLVVAKKK